MSSKISGETSGHGAVLVAALKTARSALGWSQKDLANASGISKVTIARMEAGMMSPRLDTLSALQLAMERAGASFALNDPAGGFTLRVAPKALEGGSTPKEKATPPPTTIEQMVQEMGGKVIERNAGRARAGWKTPKKAAEISEAPPKGLVLPDDPHAPVQPSTSAGTRD